MKVYAPVNDFNGVRGNVRFTKGVGETNDPKMIEWFETHGYICEKCDTLSEKVYEKCDEVVVEPEEVEEVVMMGYADKTPNFEEMTPNELRDWAKANGFGNQIKNTRNKKKLIEILRG